ELLGRGGDAGQRRDGRGGDRAGAGRPPGRGRRRVDQRDRGRHPGVRERAQLPHGGAGAGMRPRRATVGMLAAALLSAGCGTGPAAGPSASPTAASSSGPVTAAADWPTYHGDVARSGVGPGAGARFGSAAKGWVSPTLDGDVYASPILAGGLALVATENDTLYAFDAVSGAQRWSRHLADPVDASTLPCGDIRPVSGITGTPA